MLEGPEEVHRINLQTRLLTARYCMTSSCVSIGARARGGYGYIIITTILFARAAPPPMALKIAGVEKMVFKVLVFMV